MVEHASGVLLLFRLPNLAYSIEWRGICIDLLCIMVVHRPALFLEWN